MDFCLLSDFDDTPFLLFLALASLYELAFAIFYFAIFSSLFLNFSYFFSANFSAFFAFFYCSNFFLTSLSLFFYFGLGDSVGISMMTEIRRVSGINKQNIMIGIGSSNSLIRGARLENDYAIKLQKLIAEARLSEGKNLSSVILAS